MFGKDKGKKNVGKEVLFLQISFVVSIVCSVCKVGVYACKGLLCEAKVDLWKNAVSAILFLLYSSMITIPCSSK